MTSIHIIDQYCKIVRQLVNYYEKHSNHSDRDKHARQARLVIRETPIYVIEGTGPELYRRKDYILMGDMQSIIHTRSELDEEEVDKSIVDIIDAILNVWSTSNDKNKNDIALSVKTLLNLYMQYILLTG